MPARKAKALLRRVGDNRREDELEMPTAYHSVIVDLFKRSRGIASEVPWEEYEVECEREHRLAVPLRMFTSYVADLIQLRMTRSEPKPDDGN